MYSETARCEGVAIGLVVRGPYRSYDHFTPPGIRARVHVYQAPDGRLAYTTSPEGTGISWTIGSADSLEELEATFPLGARDALSEVDTFVWVPAGAKPGPAQIMFWDEEARRSFGAAMAASGGIAYMINKRRGAHLLDDRPDPNGVPSTPRTPGIIGQFKPQTIQGKAWREEVDILSLMPNTWMARRVPWAQQIKETCGKGFLNPKTAVAWSEALLAEWESRGLDLGEFAEVEVYHPYGDPNRPEGVTLREVGDQLPVHFGGLGQPLLPQVVIDAANAAVRGKGTIAALRKALREAGLYG